MFTIRILSPDMKVLKVIRRMGSFRLCVAINCNNNRGPNTCNKQYSVFANLSEKCESSFAVQSSSKNDNHRKNSFAFRTCEIIRINKL